MLAGRTPPTDLNLACLAIDQNNPRPASEQSVSRYELHSQALPWKHEQLGRGNSPPPKTDEAAHQVDPVGFPH